MKDTNGIEIKVGDLVKKCGFVKYADGDKWKISKKTWSVSKIENGRLFYKEKQTDRFGNEVEQDVLIPLPKEERRIAKQIEFFVVGDETGLLKEYTPKVLNITTGSVQEKYKVLKDVPDKNWKKGEVVAISGKVSFDTLKNGWLEKMPYETKHQHVLIVVDSIKIIGSVNK